VAEEKNNRNLLNTMPTIMDEPYYKTVMVVHKDEQLNVDTPMIVDDKLLALATQFFENNPDSKVIERNTVIRKSLMGVHTYDMLANPDYAMKFSYVDNSVEDREKFIIDGDTDEDNDNAQTNKTRVCISLAYFHQRKDERHNFKFKPEHFDVNHANVKQYKANTLE
jgi:hypothetical protein